jgi:hypothetical protein
MSYSRNIGHNILTQLLKIVFGVLTGVIVARALGPSGQGYIAYIVLIFTLLGTFGHFGITNAVAYFQKKSGFERGAIFSTNLNVLALISLCLGIVVLSHTRWDSFYKPQHSLRRWGEAALMLSCDNTFPGGIMNQSTVRWATEERIYPQQQHRLTYLVYASKVRY